MSKEKQIAEICAITSNACCMGCEETPFIPESSGICDYLDCRSCKEARLLLNAGYRKQEWISVEERLPEEVYGKHRKKITVLVCMESGRVGVGSRQRVFCFNSTKLVWEELDRFEWSGRRIVTHWMSLPEPPKGE